MLQRLHQFRRWAGVDRAVFFSNAAQMLRLVTGPITMALVLRYLTPEIQGYFYAFSGVLAMQIFLEMGFSQNILQFAAHEFAKLRFTPKGAIEGDPVAKSRLLSLGRLAAGYYAVAALVFLVAIGIGGHVFFTVSGSHGVHWQGAWWIVAAATACALAINPAWALLEGCNQVAMIAQYRFGYVFVGFAVNATALIMGAGIYAIAIGSVCAQLFGLAFLAIRWRHFFFQFLARPQHGRISWKQEIWPLQWRIAVSSMSGYFVYDMATPIAFYFCGAVEAGRWGMTFQLVRMIGNVAWTWVYTKAPRFGMMVARRQWREFDSLLRRSTVQAFIICVLGEIAFVALIPYVGHFLPRVPGRLAPIGVTICLACAAIIQIPLFAMATELRSHKRDPLMSLTVFNAVISMALMLPLTRQWGILGEAVGYMLAIAVMFILAIPVYRARRAEYRHAAETAANPA